LHNLKQSKLYGPLMMLGAAVLFATGGLLCKINPWSAFSINCWRNIIGGLLIGAYLIATHHKLRFNFTILMGAICMFGVTTLFVLANKMTTAANAIVLQYTAPVWIVVLMAIFFHVKPSRLDIGAICVVFVGILCFFLESLSTSGGLAGNLIAVAAGLFYAVVFLLNSFPKGDALSSMFYGQFFGGLLLLPFGLQETNLSLLPVTSVVLMGLFQVGLAYILFNLGTEKTPPVTASLIAGVEPILNPILVAIFWGESIGPVSLLGAAIVILGILGYQIKKASPKNQEAHANT
jgi:drug/metabolite transporter (DMT)-like permease